MKRLHWILTTPLVFVFAACGNSQKGTTDIGKAVKLDTVQAVGQTTILQYPGRIKAAEDISLAFRVSGTINRYLAKEGDHVKKGQLLVQLDPTDYQTQLEATEAEYKQIKANAERIIALYNDSSTTASNYDKAIYGLKQITAKYQHHKDQLLYTELRAPFDGEVQKLLFEANETVAAGMPVISLIGKGMPEVEINLPAAEYIRRSQFEKYYCTFDFYPNQIYPLSMISITPKTNANQLYTMRLRLEKNDLPHPSPGMNTMVNILCATEGEVQLSVPSGALLQRQKTTYVFVYSPTDKKIFLREVYIIRPLSNGRMLITSPVLKPGELIVASGVHYLKEGDIVHPLPAISSTNIGGLM